MAALVSSGQEDVSYAKVDETLGSWLRRRRHGNHGLIPQLEGELQQLKESREKLLSNQKSLTVLMKEQEELREKLDSLDQELSIYAKIDKKDLNERFSQAKSKLEEMEGHHSSLITQREEFLSIPSRPDLLDLEEHLLEVKGLEPQIRQIEQAIMQIEDRLETTQKNAEDSRFPLMNGNQAMAQVEADLDEIKELEHKIVKSKTGTWKHWVFGLICGVGVALGGFSVPDKATFFGILGGITFMMVSGLGLAMSLSSCTRKQEQLEETYQFYEVTTSPEIREIGNKYVAHQDEISTLTSQIAQSYRGLDDMRKKQKEEHQSIIEKVTKFAPKVTNLTACTDAISQALRLEEQMEKAALELEQRRTIYQELLEQGGEEINTTEELVLPKTPQKDLQLAKDRLDRQMDKNQQEIRTIVEVQDALGDLVALSAKENALEEEVERRRQEYRAVAIARKGMERAAMTVQHRFYPELNRIAGDYFSRLTGGKYKSLSLTRELEAFIDTDLEEENHSTLALSQGTVDQIYLAVRLAVADLCLSKGGLSPIVLDDALISFDQDRMECALDLLAELGSKRQIILFSCHGREGKYLANHRTAKVIAL